MAESDTLGDGDSRFWNWFKIQKCAFPAKRFGPDLPYERGICLWGPYSQIMGGECWDLAENGDRRDEARPELPQEFRGGGFLDFVRGGSNGWLEMATTLLPKRKRMAKMDRIMEGAEGWGRLHARIHRIRPARPGGRQPDRVQRATAVGLRFLRVLGSWTGPQRGSGKRRPAACKNRSPGRSGRPRPAGNCPAGPAPILYAACPSPRAWTGSGPPI